MTGGTRIRLTAVAIALLLVTSGLGAFGGTAAASSGGNPPPTADPGQLAVSLTDGDGTVNATYRVDETTGTINASYAGAKADVNVSYTDSATAIQFALDNATAENDTVVLGGGTFNGSVDVGARTGLTLDGGYSRLDGDAGRGDTVDVTSNGATVQNLIVVDSPGTGIDSLNADDVTLRNVESLDSANNGIAFANGTVRNVTIRGGSVGLSQGTSNGSTIADVTIRQAQYTGLEINSANHTVRDVTVNNTTSGEGILEAGRNNTYENVTVTNSSTEGFEVGESEVSSTNATLRNVTVEDNAANGIIADEGDGVLLSNVTAVDNGEHGVRLEISGTVRHLTATGNDWDGLKTTFGSDGATIVDVTAKRNGDGLEISAANTTVRDAVVTNNRDYGVSATGYVNNTFDDVTITRHGRTGIRLGEGGTLVDSVVLDNAKNTFGGSGIFVKGKNATVRNVTVWGNGLDVEAANVVVRNLTQKGSSGTGLAVDASNVTVDDVSVRNNLHYGLNDQNGDNAFSNVTAVDNGDWGIRVSKGTILTDSRASNNGDGSESGVRVDERNITLRNVTATGSPEGFNVREPNATLTDVVARNNSQIGFRVKDRNATLTDVVARNNADGIRIVNDGFDATLRNATVANNSDDGVYLEDRSARGLLIANATVRDNGNAGIDISPQTGSRIVDTTLTANGGPELNVQPTTDTFEVSPAPLDASNVTVGATTFDAIEAKNVSFEGSATSPSPGDERKRARTVGKLSRLDAGAFADVTVDYTTNDTLGLQESSLVLARYDSASGSYAPAASTPDSAANIVTANLTSFGPVVVLGDPESGEGGTVVDGTSTGTLDVNGTEVVDASIDYTAGQSGTATVSDLSSKPSSVPNATTSGGVDVNRVASYVEITAPEPASGANATVEIVVDRSRIGEPNDTQVWRYVGGGNGYQPLATQVQSVTGSSVRLSFETPGFSVFMVGDPTAETAGGASGGGGSAGIGESILAGERSVTQALYEGTARRVTVEFDRETTGAVAVESVGSLPDAAPDPDGRTVAAVDVTVPDDAASRSATVEIAVPRSAVEGTGVDPAALRVVEFERGSDDLRRLDTEVIDRGDGTVVLAAETPGFSTFAVVAPTSPGTAVRTPTRTATSDRSPSEMDTATPSGTATSTRTTTPSGTATPSPESTGGSGDGFGWFVALVALSAVAAATRSD
ncbi:right-handed parallel beta-helix repeat-containing protein [Haloplanus salinarum]|uniref:right-handed parallel beta-helix repeat-containing protein n=1 Tax=Haloplanus salinarum TaxID=1912324 RepID=UPI00214C5AA3|nr:right-handed parallel beta-helix repeat-containing protein [Haloplanus salinarum]